MTNLRTPEPVPFDFNSLIICYHGKTLEAYVFLGLYLLVLIWQLFIFCKAYRSRDLRNRYHITISIAILLLILSRLVVLVSSLII